MTALSLPSGRMTSGRLSIHEMDFLSSKLMVIDRKRVASAVAQVARGVIFDSQASSEVRFSGAVASRTDPVTFTGREI